jgi:hypothetical protein
VNYKHKSLLMLLFTPIFGAMLCNVDGQNRHLVTVNSSTRDIRIYTGSGRGTR